MRLPGLECKSLTMGFEAMAFQIVSHEGSARSGVLKHAHGELQTPALLLYTRRGSPLYLTPDLVQHIGSGGDSYIVDITKYLGSPSASLLAKAPGEGRGFCAMQDKLVVATNRDSLFYNYPRWDKSTKSHVRVEGFSGNRALSPQDYLTTAELFEPDLLVPLSDEVSAEASDARFRVSVDRTLKWLDLALNLSRQSCKHRTGILAPITGGLVPELRRMSAQESAKREGVFGYAICGLGTGELPGQQRDCLAAALDELPTEAIKLVQGGLTPVSILQSIAQGIDLFDATYATMVTSLGYALDLGSTSQDATAAQDTKLNMLDTVFREDTGPLVQGCQCYTCQNHNRAYVHHLLAVHEMTAQILLELHNIHQLLAWFASIRSAISLGTFEMLKEKFVQRRPRSDLDRPALMSREAVAVST